MNTFPLETFTENLPNYPSYHITNDGVLYSRKTQNGLGVSLTWRRRRYFLNHDGRKTYWLQDKHKRRARASAHVLVMEAYFGPRPQGLSVCHNDGNYLNNNISNLRYDTAKGNAADKILHGTLLRGEQIPQSVLKEEQIYILFDMAAQGVSNADLSRHFKVSPSAIGKIIRRRDWKHIYISEDILHRVSQRRGLRSPLVDSEKEKILQLRLDGKSIFTISKEIKRCERVVSDFLKSVSSTTPESELLPQTTSLEKNLDSES